WWERRRQADAAIDRNRQEVGRHLAAGFGDREWADLQVHRPGFESRQLEQVADEVAHRRHDRPAPLEEVALDLGIEDLAAKDQLEITAQPGERRPELVGDGRDERR